MSESNNRFGGTRDATMNALGAVAITGSAQTFGSRGTGISFVVTGAGNITFVTHEGDTVALTGLTADPMRSGPYTVRSITSATITGYVLF